MRTLLLNVQHWRLALVADGLLAVPAPGGGVGFILYFQTPFVFSYKKQTNRKARD